MENRDYLVNPTLACGNLLNFEKDLDILESIGNQILHLDVMDGNYVPNLCFDLPTIRAIHERYPFFLDVHLMVERPKDYILPLKESGAGLVSVHLDAAPFAIRLLRQIREQGMMAGIVLNPSLTVDAAREVLPYADLVLLMGVEPGFSGQSFLPGTYGKIEELVRIRDRMETKFLIEVDGGIDSENGRKCRKLGADILVSGAFGVFGNRHGLAEDYARFKKEVQK